MSLRFIPPAPLNGNCYEDLAFQVLTANLRRDHSRISEFRCENIEPLSALFVQILRLCQKARMVCLGHVALDGTKIQANAASVEEAELKLSYDLFYLRHWKMGLDLLILLKTVKTVLKARGR